MASALHCLCITSKNKNVVNARVNCSANPLILIRIVNGGAKFRTEMTSLHKFAYSHEVGSCAVWVCKRTLCSRVSSQRICSLSAFSGLYEFKFGLYCWKVLTQFNSHVPNTILNCRAFPIDRNLLLWNLICIFCDSPPQEQIHPVSIVKLKSPLTVCALFRAL